MFLIIHGMYCYCQLLLKRYVRVFLCILYSLLGTVCAASTVFPIRYCICSYYCILCAPLCTVIPGPVFPIPYWIMYSLLDTVFPIRYCVLCSAVCCCVVLQDCTARLYSNTCCTRLPCDLQYLYTSHIIEIMCNVLLSK